MEQTFEDYLKQARKDFTKVVAKYTVTEHLELRTAIDSLLIAYDQALKNLDMSTENNNKTKGKKPKMVLKMRISVDSIQTQRYTENEIKLEFNNDNIKIERKLVIRKNDGAVMGEILV